MSLARTLRVAAALRELAAPEVLPWIETGDNPVAGSEWSITVPGDMYWQLQSVFVPFTTDATVANRGPSLVIDDGTTILARVGNSTAIAASTAANLTYLAGLGVTLTASTSSYTTPLPDRMILMPGWRLRSITTNLQAGDDYGAPVVWAYSYGVEQTDERVLRDLAQLAGTLPESTFPEQGVYA